MRSRFAVTTTAMLAATFALAQQPQPQQPIPPPPPQPPPHQPANPQDRDRPLDRPITDTRTETRHEKKVTAQEAAEMFRSVKHSLADSIGAAERRSNGKAVVAYCCMKTPDELNVYRTRTVTADSTTRINSATGDTSYPAGRPDLGRGGTPSGSNEEKRDAQGRDTTDQKRVERAGTPGGSGDQIRDPQGREITDQSRVTSSSGREPVCVVTCLVGDNRLVELLVCSKSNEIVAERSIDSIGGPRAQAHTSHDTYVQGGDVSRETHVQSGDRDSRFTHLPVQPNAHRAAPQAAGVSQSGTPGDRQRLDVTVERDKQNVPQERDRRVVHTDQPQIIIHDSTTPRDMQRDTRMDRGFVMASRTQKASDLIGKSVRNAQNEDLGKIEEIVVDPHSGRSIYAVLSFGGFLGMGDKLFAIPWSSLELPSGARQFVLNVDKDRLQRAQGFDKGNWPDMADTRWATETHRYYGARPYWETGDETRTTQDGRMRDDRGRWYGQTQSWQKCDDLIDKDVRTSTNEHVGEIDEIVIDPDSGRAIYAIVDYRDKRFAIPWSALALRGDAKDFVLNVDRTKLLDSVAFNESNWPDMTDRRWAVEIHRHYGIDPYWSTDEQTRRP